MNVRGPSWTISPLPTSPTEVWANIWNSLRTSKSVLGVGWGGAVEGRVPPEVQILEGEVSFYDARGLDSGPENVLFCGLVVCGADPV